MASRRGSILLQQKAGIIAAGGLSATAAAIADQWSKGATFELLEQGASLELTPFLSVTPGMNDGVAFGIAQGAGPWLLIGVAMLVTVWLTVLLARSRSTIAGIALGITIGGALANVADRLQFGAVRDFIDLHWKTAHWPTFNLADVFVVTGLAGYLIVDHVFDKNRRLARVAMAAK